MSRLASCSSCGRVHSKDYICSIKRKRINNNKKNRIDTSIYGTRKWASIRGHILGLYNNVCLYTFYKENRIVEAKEVHHIIELLEDETLAYEEDNLISLSKDKHKLIHELYKENNSENKKIIQEELREMKRKWENGERELASPSGL